jgi:hypothetical protein
MGGAGIQLVDYTSNLYANSDEAAAIFIGNTTPTGNVDGIDDTDSDVGTVRIQSFNTLTQVTNTWTYTTNGAISSNEIALVSATTGSVTVSSGTTYIWVDFIASQFGNGPVLVQDVQNDTMGNVFATVMDWNTATTTSTQLSYIVKYDYQGNPLWSVDFEGLVTPASFGLAIDSAGDAYLNLVETNESQPNVSYITKVSGQSGAIIWSTEVSDIGDLAYNAVIDHNNNLVVNGVYTDNSNNLQMWVAKLDSSNGNIIWQIAMPNVGSNNEDSGLSVDTNNNILVSGTTFSEVDTGFVVQLDTNGNVLTAFTIATTNSYTLSVSDAVTDSLGNLYLSGGFSSSSFVEAGFLAQINLTSTATVGWAYQIGTGNGCIDITTTLDVDQNNNLYILGITEDPSNSTIAASLGSFSSNGNERWQYYIESPGGDSIILPGGVTYSAFNSAFEEFGCNMSYNGNGMLDLGIQSIYGEGGDWYPFILQVPANGTPFNFAYPGLDMAPIWSTASNWVPQPIELSLTPFTPTVNTSTLSVVYNPGQISTGTVSIGYYGNTEYDFTTSTVYNQPAEWQFNQDGSLQLPFQGVIRDSGMGQSLVSQNYAQIEWAQDGVLNSQNTSSYVWVDSNGVHLQTYQNLGSQNNWEFDFNGNLTFPAGNTNLFWPHMNISYTDADASSALTITDGQGGTYTFEKEQFILSPNTDIVFGDGTTQYTAYTGTPTSISSEISVASISSSSFTVDVGDLPGYWINQFGDLTFEQSYDSGNSVVYDNDGNLIVCITDYTDTSDNYNIPMIVKYDTAGHILWKQYVVNSSGSPVNGSCESAAVDLSNNIYVLVNSDGNDQSWVFQLSPSGSLLNQIVIEGTNSNLFDIEVDTSGNFYLAGVGYNGSNPAIGAVLKGNFSGITWQTGFNYSSTSTYDIDVSIALDGANPPNVYTCGYGYEPSPSSYVPELVKLDNNGNILWITALGDGDSINRYANALDVDSTGISYVAIDDTQYQGTIIASYDTNGNLRWQIGLDDTGTTNYPTEIQVGADGYIYVAGNTEDGPPGSGNIFVAKLDTEGNLQWVNQFSNFYGSHELYQWEYNGHRDIAVRNGVFAVVGITENAPTTSTQQTVDGNAIVFQFPTDGSYAAPNYTTAPEYNGYVYFNSPWVTTATTVLNNSSSTTWVEQSPEFTTGPGTNTLTASTLTSSLTTIIEGAEWRFTETGVIEFPDGTTQYTAYPGPATNSESVTGEWTSPNGNPWYVTTWNSGFSGSYDGSDPLVWFDTSLAETPSGLNSNNIRGGVVEYHAYDGSSTIVGTIWFSCDYESLPASVTHMEHASGGNSAEARSYWTMTQQNPTRLAYTNLTGGSSVMVQWTARLFWGNEMNC